MGQSEATLDMEHNFSAERGGIERRQVCFDPSKDFAWGTFGALEACSLRSSLCGMVTGGSGMHCMPVIGIICSTRYPATGGSEKFHAQKGTIQPQMPGIPKFP